MKGLEVLELYTGALMTTAKAFMWLPFDNEESTPTVASAISEVCLIYRV